MMTAGMEKKESFESGSVSLNKQQLIYISSHANYHFCVVSFVFPFSIFFEVHMRKVGMTVQLKRYGL